MGNNRKANGSLTPLAKTSCLIFAGLVFFSSVTGQKFPDANAVLTGANGGRSISESALQDGDIIVSTTGEAISEIIRKITNSPVSHSMIYVGNGMVIESISAGVRLRTLDQATSSSTLAVAFRFPKITKFQQSAVADFLHKQLGKKYNFVGIVRHPNFKVVDELCGGFTGNNVVLCRRWVGKIVTGIDLLVDSKIISSKDEFFCSELVAAAYAFAGLEIFSKPSATTPGEIPVISSFKALEYVGHLKTS